MANEKKVLEIIDNMTDEQDAQIEYTLQAGEFEISLTSPLFTKLFSEAERQLKSCLRKIDEDAIESGTITIKIKVTGEVQENPDVYEEGTAKMRSYHSLKIDGNTKFNYSLTETEKVNKSFASHEIIQKGRKFVAVPVSTAQMKLSNIQED